MKRVFLFAVLLTTPALAQQPTPIDLQMQRNNFMSAFAQCDSASITLQQEIAALKKQIDDLKKPPADQNSGTKP